MKALSEVAGVKLDAPAAAEGEGEGEKKEEGEGEGEKAEEEGGDGEGEAAAEEGEGEKKEEGAEGDAKAELPTFNPYGDVDLSAFGGLAKLPELLLNASQKHPYFGDVIKAQTVGWEFTPEGDDENKWAFAGAGALMAAAVEGGAKESKEAWFSGLVGEDDFLSLKEMAESKSDILFPGVIAGWDKKEDAIAHLATLGQNAKAPVQKVIYHTTASMVTGAKQLFAHRFGATLESFKEEDNINTFELSECAEALRHKLSASYADWKDKVGPALEALKNAGAAVAAAETPAEEGEKKEEEEKKDDEEKKEEGEGEEAKEE